MRKRIWVLLGSAIALAMPQMAAAQVTLDFEDLSPGSGFPTGYAGFTWTGGTGASSWLPGFISMDGALARPHSGSVSLWSNGGTWLELSRATPFDLTSLWMSGVNGSCTGPSATATQVVHGYLGATEMYSASLALNCSTNQLYDLAFNGVDRVVFDVASPGAVNLLIDDIAIDGGSMPTSSTPEPMSMVLLGTGLLGIAGVAHRRRRRSGYLALA